jgi:hypothetical protein
MQHSLSVALAVLVAAPCALAGSSHRAASSELGDDVRQYWMKQTLQAVFDSGLSCSHYPFGTVIVNHTDNSGYGDLICTGVNQILKTGNPILHGESIRGGRRRWDENVK